MANDSPSNPTSPPTPNEDTPSTSGDNPFWIDQLPEPALSEDGSQAKHLDEDLSRIPMRETDPGDIPPFKMVDDSPLQDEIDTLRSNLNHLIETFSSVETLDEHFKLSSAINYTTASITRLVRARQLLRSNQPNTIDHAINRAITELLKEWDRI